MPPRETLGEAKVSVKNQVVIPKPVVERLGLEPGDYLVFLRAGDDIVIRRGKITTE